jgi:hypothetical protein
MSEKKKIKTLRLEKETVKKVGIKSGVRTGAAGSNNAGGSVRIGSASVQSLSESGTIAYSNGSGGYIISG